LNVGVLAHHDGLGHVAQHLCHPLVGAQPRVAELDSPQALDFDTPGGIEAGRPDPLLVVEPVGQPTLGRSGRPPERATRAARADGSSVAGGPG
jgi:hypothetical protein